MLALKAENISKQYKLGEVGTGSLSHDINRFWAKIRGKEDPYLKIGEANDRATKGESDYVWSLKDINFEIELGDAIGIIGRNGAGKSTLLKLLSKVTKPTTGKISTNGRIASLLEVGTGFHPEMTGRENIYLNGAILGMKRHEITRKFDEIVAFSGVERYIDTPVKRYSSGMYVRLAFAVAAHLESEILIVDEVLAVGDAEFQKKCLGKMNDVSQGEGRTVLFVSHNMSSIGKLCNRTIALSKGHIQDIGETSKIINTYLNDNFEENLSLRENNKITSYPINETLVKISNINITKNKRETYILQQGDNFEFNFTITNESDRTITQTFIFMIKTISGDYITSFGNELQKKEIKIEANSKKKVSLIFRELNLKEGSYYIDSGFLVNEFKKANAYDEIIKFEVKPPSASYLITPERKWEMFPKRNNQGYQPIQIDEFHVS